VFSVGVRSTAVGLLTVKQTMYQGVLRDDERRRAKYMKRKEELEASLRKRELYERVQTVKGANEDASIQR
jgi:protein PET117